MTAGNIGLRLRMEDIGGGRVMRAFTADGRRMKVGTLLAPAYLAAIPAANRHCLIDKNYIAVWPKSGDAVSPPASTGNGQAPERHVVALGFGRFGVIEGSVLNDGPLSRAAAYALAGKPEPEAKRKRA